MNIIIVTSRNIALYLVILCTYSVPVFVRLVQLRMQDANSQINTSLCREIKVTITEDTIPR